MDEGAAKDQIQAASAHALRWAERVAASMGTAIEHRHQPDWISGKALEIRALAKQDRLRVCEHLLAGPQPAFMYVSHPDQMLCFACFGILSSQIRGTTEDAICDKCGRLSNGLYADMAIFGPISIIFGLCDDCQAAERLRV